MSHLLHDLRYAARVLLRAPGFSMIAVVTLALAIGANTAIFSVVNGLLLRPLPYPESGELVQILRSFREGGETVSYNIPRFLYFRDHNTVFENVTTYDTLGSGFNLTGGGTPERLVGSRVSKEFFSTFGVMPALGRDFSPEEDRPGGAKVIVLSHGLWKRRFGGDPSMLGKTVTLNGEAHVVIGVAPESFRYPATADLWTPLGIDPASTEKANYLEITARLKDGVTVEKARAEMKVVGEQYQKAHPDMLTADESVTVRTLQDRLYGQLRPALLVLLGTVGLVLLIACVNIANLQLARASARRREVAIRTALGASSGRIVAQLLTESVVLALAGGVVGVLLGSLTLKPLLALAPAGQAAQITGISLPDIGIDATVLLFALGLSVLSGVLFGLVPALQAARPNLNDPLKEDTARSTGGRAGRIARISLVVGEVAVALLVLTGSALLVRSFAGLTATDPGFRPEGVLTMKLSLPEARYGDPAALERLGDQIVERVSGLPGVERAMVASTLPLEGGPDLTFTIEGKWPGGDSLEGVGGAQYRASSAGYFETLEIPLVRGRLLTAADSRNSELVAVINETTAKRYWPGADPIGQRITLGMPFAPELADAQPRRIVGIVKDVREGGLQDVAPPIVYLPMGQVAPPLAVMFVRLLPINVAVRTRGTQDGLLESVQKEIWAIDPQQPITNVATMEDIVARSVGSYRFNMILMGGLAFLALILAAVGIYGVLSYLVNQRTREIGVRMALGATAGHVLRMVVRQGLVAVAIGVAIGLAAAFGATRLLASLLVGVSATDPLVFVLAPLVLAAVALLASSLPAQRASRLEPVLALRRE